jgi:PAS domain S-box-containing protein
MSGYEKKWNILKEKGAGEEETIRLAEELHRHQIELVSQNQQLREAQQQLEKSHNEYRNLFDFAPVGYFVLDIGGHISEVNLTGAAMLGIERPGLLNKPFSKYIDKESHDVLYLQYKRALREGKKAECDVQVTKQSGTSAFIHLILEPVKDTDGSIMLCRIAAIDITELKKAQESLRDSERRYRGVFENASVGISLVDLDGNWLYVNDKFCEIVGYSREALTGTEFSVLTHPDDVHNDRLMYDKLMSLEISNYFLEKRYVRKDGQIIWVSIYRALQKDEAGKPVYSIRIVTDITEQKKIEEERSMLTEELKRSNNDLHDFAYIVSHDLKEPLRAVNGFMVLLEQRYKEQLDEKALAYIDFAVNGAKRMDTMLRGMLEYSRVQTHARPLTLTEGHTAFTTAVTNLWTQITEAHAAVTCDPLPSIKADGTQLVQLLQNLISNAIKYRGGQNPEVHVGCKRQENGWLFSVRDNGIGIAPEQYERIFGMFQQVNPSRNYSGYGIGLAICKKIVERHGGKIWLESQLGKGSTFFFTIPDESKKA